MKLHTINRIGTYFMDSQILIDTLILVFFLLMVNEVLKVKYTDISFIGKQI